ncbi:hypothetical protein BJ925_2343 [Rahnella aquatilis]|nr:hypothetical protein BJ925_2343 [Rahnella aquatilis]
MVRPVLNPGRLLEPVSDCWPRRMTVHDRTRLNGQLPRQQKARVVLTTRAFAFSPSPFKLPTRWLLLLTRIAYFSKLIGIHAFAAFLQFE